MIRHTIMPVLVCVCLLHLSDVARAVTFQIDPAQSHLSITTFVYGPNSVSGVEASTGSWTSRLGGTVELDFTDTTARLLHGTVLEPLEDLVVEPGTESDPNNPAPASFLTEFMNDSGGGSPLSGRSGATRGLKFRMYDDNIARTRSGDTIGPAFVFGEVVTGVVDAGSISVDLTNGTSYNVNEAPNVIDDTLVIENGLATLTLNVSWLTETFAGDDPPLDPSLGIWHEGLVVATAQVPEPAGAALLLVASGGFAAASRRGRG
ncbi:hypothetical protein Mal64_29240 [Pseudobythopirellula maris]|uniref:PEP-CTERM protein-sorting domain-containing protein n=1 Tax=Pseudobythopirellula maris TaxID=2527991 RepID=A0A5C5ZJU1_9BACT|nr:hypothetical protein [Pseudobythopirellula maris]TWT87385.1 hypothetical protein Mal64_29240 [Pseudobythopirellula maris]